MPSIVNLKARGLTTSPNELTDSNSGGLNVAENIIIRRDHTIESRRGFFLYGDTFGTSTDRAKQLISYKDRILRHFASTLQFDTLTTNVDDQSIFTSFSGSIQETESGLRIKYEEGSGNLFITTSDGIKKISARTASDFTSASGFIQQAGGIKAIDFTAVPEISLGNQTDFFTADSVVGYRIVWGTVDLNKNLILGAPSNFLLVYNSFLPLIIGDFNNLLQQIQNVSTTSPSGSLLSDSNYVDLLAVDESTQASTVRDNAIALAEKIDNDIVFTTGNATVQAQIVTTTTATITVTSSLATFLTAGDKVILSGFTNAGLTDLNSRIFTVTGAVTTTLNLTLDTGTMTTTALLADVGGIITSYNYRNITQPSSISTIPTHNQLQSLQTYISEIITRLQSELSGVISTTLLDLYIIPLDITNAATVKLTINIPEEITANYFVQVYRTATNTATGTDVLADLSVRDEVGLVYEAYPTVAELSAQQMVVNDIVLDSFRGANLYTNEFSGEGITQANEAPPFAKDIAKFKNTMFFANTRNKQFKLFNFLGVTNFYTTKDITSIAVGSPTTITINNHGFSNGDNIVIQDSDSIPSIDGSWVISNVTTNTFTIPFDTTSGTSGTTAVAFKNKNPKILIGNTATSNVYSFTLGAVENNVVNFTSATGAAFNSVGTANYFTIYSANDVNVYYVWYYINGGTMTEPVVSNATGIKVVINSADNTQTIANKTKDAINTLSSDFISTRHLNAGVEKVNIITTSVGYTTNITATSMPAGESVSTNANGQGEKQSTKEILLSTLASPAGAVDETSISLIKIINGNTNEIVYGYYLSTAATTPGQINFEARGLNTDTFYIVVNGFGSNLTEFGSSFNPAASPSFQITSISAANPTVITSSVNHGLSDGDIVSIIGSNSTSNIDGVYTISNTTLNTFTIPITVTIAGTNGYFISENDIQSISSSADEKINRVYYSKLQQYEAVPLTNYFDVGADSKAVLRIFPLRDSLFVFKEDGVYRISGEIAPFSLALFDSSTFMTAPDSLGVTNNFLYFWTTQGIVQMSEAGVSSPPTSRDIDDQILAINSTTCPNFTTATWGLGYDSDNSYLVFTTGSSTDVYASICYRYTPVTNSWTVYTKSNTCGVVHSADDKLYFGAGDVNFLEKERKNFDRTDYADREYTLSLSNNNFGPSSNVMALTSVSDLASGDVVFQNQYVTVYTFNQLLKKLDLDGGVGSTNYFSLLQAQAGSNLRDKLVNSSPSIGLAAKLDADSGVASADYLVSINGATGTITGNTTGSNTIITLNNKVISSINLVTNEITIPSHGFLNNDIVTIVNSGGSLPSPIAPNTRYYIILIDANTFKLSLSSFGAEIDITTSGSGINTVFKTHNLQTGRIVIIANNTTSVPSINGKYQVTVPNLYQFTIPVTVTTAGTNGTYQTVDLDFRDIQACYNTIVDKLNADAGLQFNNYTQATVLNNQEAIITAVSYTNNTITLGANLEFVVGPITAYKAIQTVIQYEPNHMEDPLGLKHLSEMTMMFGDKKFTNATVSFATDLVPYYTDIQFNGSGNGIFGISMNFGGQLTQPQFFGGMGNQAPLRTYIPRDCQRCRYVTLKYTHKIAREHYSILGVTLTGQTGLSTRAYK